MEKGTTNVTSSPRNLVHFAKLLDNAVEAQRKKSEDALLQYLIKRNEEQKMLITGGQINRTPSTLPLWKRVPTSRYIILIVFCAVSFILYILNCNYVLILNEQCYIGYGMLFIGYILYFTGLLLYEKTNDRSFYIQPPDSKVPSILVGGNGIGFTLSGEFRRVGETVVGYHFFCIGGPIIPFGCYRISGGKRTFRLGNGYTASFKIYGSEKMDGLELVTIYLYNWGMGGMLLSLIPFIFAIFD